MRLATTGLVLDTNVVLDWLVFDDAATRALAPAWVGGRWLWWVSPSVLAEIEAVLARPLAERWEVRRKQALTRDWQPLARRCAEPHAGGTSSMRCRDPDDQKFVDLALAQRAGVLLTRDRALLALARAAAGFGLTITTPARWTLPPA
jgi:uncharacterized protein